MKKKYTLWAGALVASLLMSPQLYRRSGVNHQQDNDSAITLVVII